jgi:hypothetical protein
MLGQGSVIVDDLALGTLAGPPHETNAPLPVDPNAVLTPSFALQHFQTIRRRDAQIIQTLGGVQHSELATGYGLNLDGEPQRGVALPNAFGLLVGEATDHVEV